MRLVKNRVNATKEKIMNENNFFCSHVSAMVYQFEILHGRQPNELHISETWQTNYHNTIKSLLIHANKTPDIYGKNKHFWFMDMRVFYEIFSDYVTWSEETSLLKESLFSDMR